MALERGDLEKGDVSHEKSECAYNGCGKEPLKSSKGGYCIFHAKAEEKSEREFDEAFEKYMNEIKTNDLDYNFSGFIFVGNVDFRKYFEITTGFKNANFGETEFYGNINFRRVKFYGDTYFRKAEFHGEVNFGRAEFYGEANLRKVEFHEYAHFRRTEFGRDANFGKTEFRENANFRRAEFHEYVNFRGAKFHGSVNFGKAEFRTRGHISPKSIEGEILFERTILENVSLTPLNLGKSALINFENARVRNSHIKREDIEGHILQERQKDFSKAKEIYLLLKNNFHSLGRYDDESWAFKKEKDMERKSYFHAGSLKWLGSMFWNILYGYGERPFWIFGWCGLLLLSSSFIYWLSKGVFQVMGNCLVPVEDYWNNLYFSIVTFTTLGYGDFRPIGKIRVLASIEALLGIFFIALFIFTFARRTGGR